MLLMVEKSIRAGICHSIYVTRYAKANNRYMKDYDKNKEWSYIQYWDVKDLYRWAMSQKLPVNNFEWMKDTSQFNDNFTKSYNEESGERYFLEEKIRIIWKTKKTLTNINKLFNGRNNAIKFVDYNSSMILEAKRKAAEDENKPKPTKAKTKGKRSLFELHEKFTNEIKNDEKNIN